MLFIEDKKEKKYIFLILFIITGIIFLLMLYRSIKNVYFDLYGLLLFFSLFVIFLFNYIKYDKYLLQVDENKIVIKIFKVNTIIIKDIDYYSLYKSNTRGVCDFLIIVKGIEYHFTSFHIFELVNLFDKNQIKRLENINLGAINRQAKAQRLELILMIILFVLSINVVPFLVKNKKIENEDIYAPIRTYALINDKRFAIFPVLENENIIEKKFVQTNQSMQIYLLAKYDEKEFQEEKMRLYNPSDGNHAWPIYNDDKFYYATIITIYKKNVFEYACLNDEKNEIAYIYIQNVKYNEVCFEKKYLPVEFRYYYNELMVTKDEYNYYH